MRSNISIVALMAVAGLWSNTGCREAGTVTTPTKDLAGPPPPDLTMSGNMGDIAMTDDGGPPPDMTGGNKKDCAGNGVYVMGSIATMRQSKAGCYEFDNVVTISPSHGGNTLTIYVQDAMGGDWSGMQVKCSSTSTSHICAKTGPVYTALANIVAGHSVTVKGTYIKTVATKFEEFYLDSIVDNGAGVLPAPTVLMPGDISRNSQPAKNFFQKVSVNIVDPLVMYDWSPTELAFSGVATKCPYQFGFGMAPMSANAAQGMSCPAGNMAQPAAQKTPIASEVLIGTDFFKGFTISSDCRCYVMFKDAAPTAPSKVSGMISGILVFSVPFGAIVGYQYLAPLLSADFPITNTTTM